MCSQSWFGSDIDILVGCRAMISTRIGLAFALVGFVGCGPSLQGRARVALRCHAVTIHSTGAGGQRATGCGRQANFVCSADNDVCVLEGVSVEAPAVREMDAIAIEGFRCIAFATHQNRALSVCAAVEQATASFAACPERVITMTFDADGHPEALGGTPSMCIGRAIRSVQPSSEFASMVVRLERD